MSARIRSLRRSHGFTLLELVVAIAIIGILAATAITSFTRYQWRSKRSEAYANLESIRKVELAYNTEFGAFVSAQVSPAVTTLSGAQQNWKATGDRRFSTAAPGAGFETLGWLPEGATYFDYEVVAAADTGNGPAFMAAAFGDVDNDGGISALLYAHPDNANGVPDCSFCGGVFSHTGPPKDPSNQPIYSVVSPVLPPGADDF